MMVSLQDRDAFCNQKPMLHVGSAAGCDTCRGNGVQL